LRCNQEEVDGHLRKGNKKKSLLVFILVFLPLFITVNRVIDVRSTPIYSQNPILFVYG